LGVVAVTLVATFATTYQSVAARSLVSEIRNFATATTTRPASESLEAFSIQYLKTHALASGGSVLVVLPSGRVQTAGSQALEKSPIVAALLRNPPRHSVVIPPPLVRRPSS
jgi:hypothetical protein